MRISYAIEDLQATLDGFPLVFDVEYVAEVTAKKDSPDLSISHDAYFMRRCLFADTRKPIDTNPLFNPHTKRYFAAVMLAVKLARAWAESHQALMDEEIRADLDAAHESARDAHIEHQIEARRGH